MGYLNQVCLFHCSFYYVNYTNSLVLQNVLILDCFSYNVMAQDSRQYSNKLRDKIEYACTTIYLCSNNKVNFKKLSGPKYELYMKSPMAKGVNVWEMLPVQQYRRQLR